MPHMPAKVQGHICYLAKVLRRQQKELLLKIQQRFQRPREQKLEVKRSLKGVLVCAPILLKTNLLHSAHLQSKHLHSEAFQKAFTQ